MSAEPAPVVSGSSAGAATGAQAAAGAPVRKPPPAPAPAIDGAPLFQKYCALCHGKDATGYAADNAPSLVSRTFLESASDSFIAQGIRLGRPGTAMAGYAKELGGPLERAEIYAIVRFLRTRGPAAVRLPSKPETGDPAKGARLYAQQCVKCHGTEKTRGKAPVLYNPEFLSAATPSFLRYAIVNGRPPTEMPAYGKILKDADVENLVSYLKSKAPGPRASQPAVDTKFLATLPVVMNPKGPRPAFTLREQRFVAVDQVKAAFDAKSRLVIIDARAASDFIASHIPGAISNPYYDKTVLDRIPNDGTWVLAYCACPHHASGEVVDELRKRGFKNTAVIDEGILEWQRRGYPMEGQAVPPGNSKADSKAGPR